MISKLPRTAFGLVIGLVATFELYGQTTFSPSKDNTLIQNTTGALSNGANPSFFVGRTNSAGARRGLLAFDLSSIQPGSTVTSVTLKLNMTRSMVGAQNIALRRVSADWGEGTSSDLSGGGGGGSSSTPGDATWIHRFFNTTMWSTAGGDFSSTVSASLSVNNIGAYTWESTPEMVADVQGWVNDPSTNFGWILIGNETTRSTKQFASRQNSNAANRPVLTVTFIPPTSVEDDPGLPTQFNLAQNYPNPFNPSTIINYSVPSSTNSVNVVLEVFNLLGQKVRTLVNEPKPSGSHGVQWDGKNDAGELLASGVYVYRLRAGDFVASKKMAFVR